MASLYSRSQSLPHYRCREGQSAIHPGLLGWRGPAAKLGDCIWPVRITGQSCPGQGPFPVAGHAAQGGAWQAEADMTGGMSLGR